MKAEIKCTRCTEKGYVAAKCSTKICCGICGSHEHVNFKCSVLKMPRPVAHAIRYDVHGLGFYHIHHPSLPRAKKDTKLALILGGRWATLKGSFDVAA